MFVCDFAANYYDLFENKIGSVPMTNRHKTGKVGRNDPCPCKSGKKYKKCCGAAQKTLIETPEFQRKIAEIRAIQKQREEQQGLGRSIVSIEFKGYRFVAVGGKLFYSDKWKTFHDFLFAYMKTLFGPDWGNAELKKPRENRSPFLNWYQDATRYMNAHLKERGKVQAAPAIGVVAAYLSLAYDLYCLEHNAKVQSVLVNRLRKRDQFYGARYEASVAGSLLRAGFEIEFENESDSSTSHCELTATYRPTGKKFSVEAKARLPEKTNFDVGNQLYEALRKKADHNRLIFIEINVPDDATDESAVMILGGALKSIQSREEKLTVDGMPAPPAYVVVTNHPHYYSPEAPCRTMGLIEGFKMPDFRLEYKHMALSEALDQRERHKEVLELMKSMSQHSMPPSTFDGEIPEFEFGDSGSRLVIGHKYLIPDGNGGHTTGQLENAIVLADGKSVQGVYKLDDGRRVISSCPLTEEELNAYRKHPDTFFGIDLPASRQIDDPLEMYDWLLSIYQKTPKERLLSLMKGAAAETELNGLSQSELASKYCLALVQRMNWQYKPDNNQRIALLSRIIEDVGGAKVN
jgi:hypothetical protein